MINKKMTLKVCLSAIIVTVIFLNISVVTESDEEKGYLSLFEVEALASDTEWNNWIDWIDQGFTKDEREEVVACQSGNNTSGGEISVGGTINGVPVEGSIQVGSSNPAGTTKITCAIGSENCTPTDC